jgi:hypothetical protein
VIEETKSTVLWLQTGIHHWNRLRFSADNSMHQKMPTTLLTLAMKMSYPQNFVKKFEVVANYNFNHTHAKMSEV